MRIVYGYRPMGRGSRRRSGRAFLALLLLPIVWAACKKPAAQPVDACLTQCRLRANELGCPHPEGCEGPCTALRNATACAKQLHSFEDCFLKLPRERWECGDDGVPVPNAHSCEPEKGYVEDCLLRTNGKL